MTFYELKQKEKELHSAKERNHFTLRIHRAISWGLQAEEFHGLDERFIFYWISFNALYGANNDIVISEKTAYNSFFSKICSLDTANLITTTLISIQNPLRVLFDNKYVYTAFWDYFYHEEKTEEKMQEFENKRLNIRKLTYSALIAKTDQVIVLKYLFGLLNTLRNQIFHGAATYKGQTNREQLTSACAILEKILPIITDIVFCHSEIDWNEPMYPVIDA